MVIIELSIDLISRKEEYYQNEGIMIEEGNIGSKMSKYHTKGKKKANTLEIVNSFRSLCSQPFHAAAHRWLKFKEITKTKSDPFTFTPTINEKSKRLDKERIGKHIVEVPKEEGRLIQ